MKTDSGLTEGFLLALSAVIAVVGLVLAGRSVDAGMELAGWLFFAFGVAFAFRLAGRMAVAPATRSED